MNNPRASYLNISPYSRHSPHLQIKTELKKHSSSLERPKSTKMQYAGATTRGQTPVNNPEMMERKYSPFGNKKVDLMASLYHLAKTKQQKEKPGTAKLYKSRDVPVKKTVKNNNRNSDKINEKMAIYQYLNHKASKKSEESKILHPSMQYTPSRHGSKSHLQDEKDFSHERRLLEASILQQRQLFEAMEEAQKAMIKSNSYAQNQNNLAMLLKSAQKSSHSNIVNRNSYASPQIVNLMSMNRGPDDRRKINEPRGGDFAKEIKMNINYQDISQPREKVYIQQESEVPSRKHHRRGLSTGQNPIYMEQQLAMEKLALEQEKQERIRQQQLQQQILRQQQMQQMQMQQYKMKDPQQEEDEYYEEFFHMDKMTFDFERLIIAQKLNQSQLCTPTASPMNKKSTSHSRTKSIEEPNSLLPTKSTSRWTTKRSSIGDDYHYGNGNGGRDHFNLIEQISDLDKTDEKEEIRRYYKM